MFNKQGAKNGKQQAKARGTFVGTPLYCAPEMLENNQSGLFSDLWALGVIIFEMSSGQKMFSGKNNKDIFDKIIKQEIFFPYCIDQSTCDIIEKLTNPDPQMRLGLKNTALLKQHPFFKEVDFEKIANQTCDMPKNTDVVDCMIS